MNFSPMKYFKGVDIPIALFYGASDRWVPIEGSINVWKDALKASGNQKYEIHRIKQSGQLMILDEDNNPKEEIIFRRIYR